MNLCRDCCSHFIWLVWSFSALAVARGDEGSWKDQETTVFGFIDNYCHKCHDDEELAGDLDFLAVPFDLESPGNRELWIKVLDRVKNGEMPPPEKAGDLTDPGRGWVQTRPTPRLRSKRQHTAKQPLR